jgi:hypothetical protein
MISLIIYELAVILLYLTLRALMPELFVIGSRRVCATAPVKRRARAHRYTPDFVRHQLNDDPARGAGMGMMMR